MSGQTNLKQLIKILVGVAWLDGKVQPEESKYLQRIAKEKDLADDPELKPWLYELRSASSAECYRWIEDYLGTHPSSEACYQLVEAICGLIYSDGEMAAEEAKLVNQLLQIDPAKSEGKHFHQAVMKAIQNLYRRWVDTVRHIS
jgi:uncharacterized tellurite resistance protein B-like protein